jgi:hypothetical protein
MREEKKGQESSAAESKQVAGGAPVQQEPEVKDQHLSDAELDKVAGGVIRCPLP